MPVEEPEISRRPRWRWPFWSALAVLAVGLLVTGVLTWLSVSQRDSNEKRLLRVRAKDVGLILTEALPGIQSPLASAAALANATHGDVSKFKRFIAPYVGVGGSYTYLTVSLWRTSDPARGPVAVVGPRPLIASSAALLEPFFARVAAAKNLSVIGLLNSAQPRLGYGFTGLEAGPYAAYGEAPLPPDHYTPVPANSAFADIDFALYLGPARNPSKLLVASVRRLPLQGERATAHVPFGDQSFTVAVVARGPLAGSLPQSLPWLIGVVGVLLALGAAALTARLIERRRSAEHLAGRLEALARENERLYAEQRGIAQTLQHALLPNALTQLPGLESGARYEAGVEGVEIGGDWYDLIRIDEHRLMVVVGDVSGRGLRAATAMAELRFAIHAYSAQGDSPGSFLAKLSKLVSIESDAQLATILCVCIDTREHELSVTSAGHLPPLLITREGGRYLESDVGLPVGVDASASYEPKTFTVSGEGTLLAFTDGLVERRGESLDTGLERLRANASGDCSTLDDLLGAVLEAQRGDQASDDTVIVGVRWKS